MEKRTSVCRICGAFCPIVVTLEGSQIIKVEGDFDAPLYRGFTCRKGRALPQAHHNPRRLLHSLKRLPDGSHVPISSEQLVEEIAERLARIIDAHGPRAVATYLGGGATSQPVTGSIASSFMAAIGSPMEFSALTVDQPGLVLSEALHGKWQGGRVHPKLWNAMLLVGGNPVVSKQHLLDNPASHLKQLQREGVQLIVIDPRRTETAQRAAVHLQAIPGEDPTVLAGLIHLIFALEGVDEIFVRENAEGAAALRQAVAGFTPDYVAARAGLKKAELLSAARILVGAQRGDTGLGVGPSMATRGTLSSYLALCIQTLRGWWAREGDPVSRPKVLTPRRDWRAQAMPRFPAWGFGVQTSVRGLQQTLAGMPTAALPDLMLTHGSDRVRALFLHAGACYSWPDAQKTVKALSELDLLVVHDLELSATSALADYVIATYDQLEVPAASVISESLSDIHPGYAWPEPYAYYRPPVVEPPEGADLMESWRIYYRVAQKLGLSLSHVSVSGMTTTDHSDGDPQSMFYDMKNEPSTDDIFEKMCEGSAVPLSEVKKHPHGGIFEEARDVVKARDPACVDRFQLADGDMLAELARVRNEDELARRGTGDDYPFQLICRRMMHSTNSNPRPEGLVHTGFNPLWMHPDDMERLSLEDGDEVQINSRGGAITGFVEGDETMRRGVVGMTHGFGSVRDGNYDPRRDGSNVNTLVRWEDDPDAYHGQPRMSAVPVAIRATNAPEKSFGRSPTALSEDTRSPY